MAENFVDSQNILTFASLFTKRAFSSVGLEHLPYKQRVGGSNPSTPTWGDTLWPFGAAGFSFFV